MGISKIRDTPPSFFLGTLPWKNVPQERIVSLKESVTSLPIVPDELKDYLHYVRDLEFEEKPDYDFLIRLFDPSL